MLACCRNVSILAMASPQHVCACMHRHVCVIHYLSVRKWLLSYLHANYFWRLLRDESSGNSWITWSKSWLALDLLHLQNQVINCLPPGVRKLSLLAKSKDPPSGSWETAHLGFSWLSIVHCAAVEMKWKYWKGQIFQITCTPTETNRNFKLRELLGPFRLALYEHKKCTH